MEQAFHTEPDGAPIISHGKCKFHKTIYTVPWFNNLRKQDSGTWDISEKADGKNAVEAKLNAGRFGEAE